jgi:hypothetical protein
MDSQLLIPPRRLYALARYGRLDQSLLEQIEVSRLFGVEVLSALIQRQRG